MIFQVRRYKGPDNPQDGYEDVEAESANKAAEKVCGEPLTVRAPRWKLRARMLSNPQESIPLTYYAKS